MNSVELATDGIKFHVFCKLDVLDLDLRPVKQSIFLSKLAMA